MNSDKKSSLLYVLKILKKYTDKNHMLTYAEIARKLREEYNSELERKTIARNIEILMDNGFDIIKNGNNGVYLGARDFEDGELVFLTDAIYSSKSIPTQYAKDLVEKLTRNNSIYDKRKYTHLEKFDDNSRSDNKQLFYTIEQIEEAISSNKKIEFQYGAYSQDKKLKLRKDGSTYKINPYFMVNNNGKYYLVCNKDGYPNLANYKIENIENAKMLERDAVSERAIECCENGINKENYIKEHPYMFNDEIVSAEFEIEDSRGISAIYEWFGKDTRINKNIEVKLVARVKANKQAIILLAVQYGEYVKLLSPDDVKKKIASYIEMLKNKYV